MDSTHQVFIHQVRSSLITKLQESKSELQLGQHELAHISELLSDDALLVRFALKTKFTSIAQVQHQLLAHIDWRLEEDLPKKDVKSLSETSNEYFEKGLLKFFGQDVDGRPLVILDMRHYSHKPSSGIEDLRSYFIFFMEITRKYLLHKNLQDEHHFVTQIAVLVDLQYVQVSQLSLDMIPTLYDLFHHHFPQIIGVVYVLNYGWIHAGLWSILKAALPESATRKMVFLSKKQQSSVIKMEDLNAIYNRDWSAIECPIFHQFAFIHPDAINKLHSKSIYQALCGSSHLAPINSGKKSPVKFSIANLESDLDSDLDEWYDAHEEFDAGSSYHEVSIDDEDGNHIRPSRSNLPFTDNIRPVKSASDLQQLLRVPSTRELNGLQPLPRAPSSKTLSSLMMTPIHTQRSKSTPAMSKSKSLPKDKVVQKINKRRRKLSTSVADGLANKKPERWGLTRWICRICYYLFGIPKRIQSKDQHQESSTVDTPKIPNNCRFVSFIESDKYGLSSGAVSLFFLAAISWSWIWWRKRNQLPFDFRHFKNE